MDDQTINSDREKIAAATQGTTMFAGSVLTGWIIVAEGLDQQGHKWLARLSSENLTEWQRQGFLHNALYEDWGE